MFRKTVLALTTIATLGAAALAPTAASAGYYGHGYGHGYGYKHRHYSYGYGYCFWKPVYDDYGYRTFIKVCR